MAHFHYTIMGGLVFTFFAAIYFWVPKMTGCGVQRAAREDPLLDDVHRLQLDLRADLRDRVPRPVAAGGQLPVQPPVPERLGVGLGVPARAVDARLPLQPRLLAGDRQRAGRVEPVGLALDRVAAALARPAGRLRRIPVFTRRAVRLRDGRAVLHDPRPRRWCRHERAGARLRRPPGCSSATRRCRRSCSRARRRSSSSRSSSASSTCAR